MALPQSHARSTAIAIRILIFALGVALVGLTAWLGWSANHNEVEAERRRIDNALDQTIAGVLDQQRSVAWWDDAVRKVAMDYDAEFTASNFGLFLTETYQQDEVYIVDGMNRPVYTHRRDASETEAPSPAEVSSRLARLKPVLDGVRRGERSFSSRRPDLFLDRQAAYQKLGGVRTTANWFSAVMMIDDQPSIVTAITIGPNVDMSLVMDRPYLLVSIVRITPEVLEQVGRSLLISDLRLTPEIGEGPLTASEPFVTDEGHTAGYLTWKTAAPGQPILSVILPLAAILSIIGGVMAGRMLTRIEVATDALAVREEKARHDARHDDLSSLPNRSAFHDEAGHRVEDALASSGRLRIGYIDIDRFKDINDTLGHHKGDILIREFGARLRRTLPQDIFLARIGGDEFAMVESGHAVERNDIGALIAEALATPLQVEDLAVTITSSVGMASLPQHGTTLDDLTRHADIALYEAKRQGRNRAVTFDGSMAKDLSERHRIETSLREAIRTESLELYYQPLVDARTGRIEEAEALLRWHHPELGTVPPSVFVPIAEEGGLMPELGDFVLRRAVRQARDWPDLSIAINLSPLQFRHRNLTDTLLTLTDADGVDPRRIILEVTESLLLNVNTQTADTLKRLRRAGFRIALDDFGTGYSSLRYLLDLSFDLIKIDRSFVSGTSQQMAAHTIVAAIVEMGHALGSRIVAEGVETEEERRTMAALGCDLLQGYLFAKPLPAPGLAGFVASFNADVQRRLDDGPEAARVV
ncbi:putative bifunctional diguanylate cyclase/phosphodiesterase [Aureimonas phyllosphaerae]|uniref:Diguanylate cyclase (GGDEF)-like protein n=1 Tax=Aureimonas phyllosphaerae TaxID=1166078 RepID=A0A7W6BSA0_9HYPH|nr:EAL domain-containing protein [Aureimonas phyllosphaerae]MBB3937116.1 diguanylate cyclase (GGDEF)-like protein [Aureimonas phyllosphaerae]MBB3961247.1 diguanylate cyclase (GGDEF)-like protein [Aureimonas phyllosphaerae]